MRRATTYEEWAKLATELDALHDNESWKSSPFSSDYDYRLVQNHIEQFRDALQAGDMTQLMLLTRALLARNVGHMGKPELYTYTYIGTKRLIERYLDQTTKVLQHILDTPDLELDIKYSFFSHVRQAYGRTAVLLSGGASFGLYHLGVLKCLHRYKLLPRIMSGSSSGAIVASLLCTRTDEEIEVFFRQPDLINLNVFEPAGQNPRGVLERLTHLLKHGSLYDSQTLIQCLRNDPKSTSREKGGQDLTFLEAYNRTRRILNVTVSSATSHEMQLLFNYLTAPNVVIWSAVAASCAAPGLFPPTPLLAKDKRGQLVPWDPTDVEWIDGSVQNDLPMQRLSELFNVNHFLVSQVNPYVVPFLYLTDAWVMDRILWNTVGKWWRRVWTQVIHLGRQEVLHRLEQVKELHILPWRPLYVVQSVLAQKYTGDITILPWVSLGDYWTVIVNPTLDILTRYMRLGERATWPKLSIIRNHCQIELFLDHALYVLRSQKLARLYSPDSTVGETAPTMTQPGVVVQRGHSQHGNLTRRKFRQGTLGPISPLNPLVTASTVQVATSVDTNTATAHTAPHTPALPKPIDKDKNPYIQPSLSTLVSQFHTLRPSTLQVTTTNVTTPVTQSEPKPTDDRLISDISHVPYRTVSIRTTSVHSPSTIVTPSGNPTSITPQDGDCTFHTAPPTPRHYHHPNVPARWRSPGLDLGTSNPPTLPLSSGVQSPVPSPPIVQQGHGYGFAYTREIPISESSQVSNRAQTHPNDRRLRRTGLHSKSSTTLHRWV
ncbi:Lipase 5 [Dispira parvispora]|uniref:Patatin-like phospholipase domain-containing protein n=1 Tax=Dispira parvispora TaxID=1520584 RepID=A0A9W8AUH1_9FUNG|nr:Lipase 5 [Dispira parvispora]